MINRIISKTILRFILNSLNPVNPVKILNYFVVYLCVSAICVLFTYPTAAIGKEKGDDYSIIYKRNIFGFPPPKKEIKSILKPEKIPLSERLLLKGVVVREKGFSLAVIESRETKRENLYKVGDFLLEGEIILIEENRVVIRDKENKEIPIFFAYDRGSFVPSKNFVLRPSRKRPKVLRMKELEKELKTKLPLLSRVRVKPTLISGKVNGYQVTNIPSDSFFETIGIKNGDLIRRINGTQITSIPKAYELYRNLKPDSTVKVDIVRDGKPITLSYKLE